MPDQDGYPTAVELDRIRMWPIDDPRGWLGFIQSCWHMADWGWHTGETRDANSVWTLHHVSTGGWSGNESIIHHAELNRALWMQVWQSTRRGGHYEFLVPA